MDGVGDTRNTGTHWAWQLAGLVLGPLAVYAYAISIAWEGQTGDATPDSIWGWIFATAFYAVFLTGWLYLIHRFVCRRSLRQLNRRSGTFWSDLVQGLILAGVLYFAGGFISYVTDILQLGSTGQVENIFQGILGDPWAIFMLLGPYTFLAAAMYEEFLRVFLLDRALALWPGPRVLWLIIAASAVLFALCHIYQGPSGMLNSLIFGVLLAVCYQRFGRVLPMMIAHGVYDFICISFALIWAAFGLS